MSYEGSTTEWILMNSAKINEFSALGMKKKNIPRAQLVVCVTDLNNLETSISIADLTNLRGFIKLRGWQMCVIRVFRFLLHRGRQKVAGILRGVGRYRGFFFFFPGVMLQRAATRIQSVAFTPPRRDVVTLKSSHVLRAARVFRESKRLILL